MTTSLEVEQILRRQGIQYTFLADGRWRIGYKGYDIVLLHDEDGQWLTFIVPFGPADDFGQPERQPFLVWLLRANWDVPCGAFAIYPDTNELVFSDQIPTDDLSETELLASLNSCALAIDNYGPAIRAGNAGS